MIKVGTYNVLNPTFAARTPIPFLPSGGTNWGTRELSICQNLMQADLDIFSLQEISQQNFQTLRNRLGPQYQAVYTGHSSSSDGVAFFYKTNRFAVSNQSSPSYATIAGQTRYSIICDLKDQQTQRTYQVAATHLFGGPHRENGNSQLAQLLRLTNSTNTAATIVLGDFNEDQYAGVNSRLAMMNTSGFQHDGSTQESEIGRNRRIDWIFARSAFPMAMQPLPLPGQIVASDHYLVGSQIHLTMPSLLTPQTTTIAQPPIQSDSSEMGLSSWDYLNPLKWAEWICDWIKRLFA